MYYIVSLAEFGNAAACYGLVGKAKIFGIFFLEEVAKSYTFYNVFSNVIFYLRVLQKFRVLKGIPMPVCLVALMI